MPYQQAEAGRVVEKFWVSTLLLLSLFLATVGGVMFFLSGQTPKEGKPTTIIVARSSEQVVPSIVEEITEEYNRIKKSEKYSLGGYFQPFVVEVATINGPMSMIDNGPRNNLDEKTPSSILCYDDTSKGDDGKKIVLEPVEEWELLEEDNWAGVVAMFPWPSLFGPDHPARGWAISEPTTSTPVNDPPGRKMVWPTIGGDTPFTPPPVVVPEPQALGLVLLAIGIALIRWQVRIDRGRRRPPKK